MANTVKEISIKKTDGTYDTKTIAASTDVNGKDIVDYVASVTKSGTNLVVTDGDDNSTNVDLSMTGATAIADGAAGVVPAPTTSDNTKFLKGDGTWASPADTTYQGSSNVSIDSSTNVIDLTDSGVTGGNYGPQTDVTGTSVAVPKFTIDAKGRMTSAGSQTYSLGSHAATTSGYGSGTDANFGHTKLSDTYNSLVSGGDAAGGIAASQNALYNAYNELSSNIGSHVGMIIHSTTLDTEEKVKAIYGGTTWVQIQGRMLLGADSSHAVNSTGGSATHTIAEDELPSHNHSIPALSGTAETKSLSGTVYFRRYTAGAGNVMVAGTGITSITTEGFGSSYNAITSSPGTGDYYTNNLSINASHDHSVTTTASTTGAKGSGTEINIMNPYKAVYIWERTA